MNLQAATLNEILVVMILTGITTFVVFEGLSLYQRMYSYATSHNNQSVSLYDNYLRVQSLFVNADSICEADGQFKIYRQNEPVGALWISDSLLFFKPQNVTFTDTLIKDVSEYKIKASDSRHMKCIDSLVLTSGKVTLKFGIDLRPDRLALVTNMELEDNFENYED
jgi:hypothetical protein